MNELEELGYKYIRQEIDKMIEGKIPLDEKLIRIYNQYCKAK